jgi:two-component system sensor kinase FixL
VEASVTDKGPGIQDDWADRLFTPFATTKRSGMGMGLSISQAIIRAHGGEIGYRNNESGGTTFWFTLPTVERESRDGE